MKQFPAGIQFKYPWRSYQKAIIDEMDMYLKKQHLHLVAPPGSGKTVIGLEVMLRFNQSTLILAPTIAIRDQWIDRFVELFYQKDEKPAWITTDLKQSAFVTVSTYQAFHQWMKEQEKHSEADKRHPPLAEHVKTIVFDEAHHLRTAWWRSALRFKEQLADPAVVALTATPPYDVTVQEWNRYVELCGEIDAEISIAELVRESELAPFQDYVWACKPLDGEKKKISEFRKQIHQFHKEIVANQPFVHLLENHPWMAEQSLHIEEILENPAYFSSMLIFLKAAGSTVWKEPVKLTGMKPNKVPSLTLEWLGVLLSHLFYKDAHVDTKEALLADLKSELKRLGAIERRKVVLTSNHTINRMLIQSPSKLEGIRQVVAFEEQQLKSELRMVVLTDYIMQDDLPKNAHDEKPLRRLGAIPIFEALRRAELPVSIAVLTGSIVIIPKKAAAALNGEAEKWNIPIQYAELNHDSRFVKVKINAVFRRRMVYLLTTLFEQGHITVLIGTTALLGEGWDAPCVNVLALATYVGAFMLSNQMRGRAIRVEKGNPMKTANIWHFVCIDSTSFDGGEDYVSLKRRFKALIGLSHHQNVIQTGINRLQLAAPPFQKVDPNEENARMMELAKQRNRLFRRWKEAVQINGKIKEELRNDKKNVPKPVVFTNTIKALSTCIILLIWFFFDDTLNFFLAAENFRMYMIFLLVILFLGILSTSSLIWKLIKITLRNITIEKNMQQVGKTVYDSLFEQDLVQTKLELSAIQTKEIYGVVICWLEKGTIYEQNAFLQALQEIVDPIENPRYLIRRTAKGFLGTKVDYHAVPQAFGQNKESAEVFLKHWKKNLGKAELIYTRTVEGRKILLKARAKAMSGQFLSKSEQISVWK